MPAGLASETKCVGLSLLKGLRVVLADIMRRMVWYACSLFPVQWKIMSLTRSSLSGLVTSSYKQLSLWSKAYLALKLAAYRKLLTFCGVGSACSDDVVYLVRIC